jgi:hypothetical protein
MLWLGIAAILAASLAYNAGVVLQALDAREEPADRGLRLAMLASLLRRRRWVAGTLLSVVAFPLQVVAYAEAPLTVVQPGLAVGLILLLVLGARLMGEPLRRIDFAAVFAIIAGLGLIAASGPARNLPSRNGAGPLIVMALLAAVMLAPYALRSRLPAFAVSITVSSGFAFAWNDLATKMLSDGVSAGNWPLAAAWLGAVAGSAVIATLSEMTAFQHASVRRVVPAVFVLETVVPIVLAPLLLRGGAGITAVDVVPMGAGLVLVVAAIAVLASSAPVAWCIRPAQAGRRAAVRISEARRDRRRRTAPEGHPRQGPGSRIPDAIEFEASPRHGAGETGRALPPSRAPRSSAGPGR